MGNFLRAVNKGVSAALNAASGPWEFVAAGKVIRCPHCSNTKFTDRLAVLNGGSLPFRKTILVCSQCSRIEWFEVTPERQ